MTVLLEHVSEKHYKGFFVDLYVRCNNHRAINMYEGMGYSVYRRVREYYGSLGVGKGGRDEEDAFGKLHIVVLFSIPNDSADMRKPLERDPNRRSVRANGRDILVPATDVS